MRAEALAGRRAELAAELERRRAALGALADERPPTGDAGDDPVAPGLERIGSALAGGAARPSSAPAAAESANERATEVARVREAAERAASAARRVEELLGRRRQDSLESRIVGASELLERLDALLEATAEARDAVGEHAAALERRMLDERDSRRRDGAAPRLLAGGGRAAGEAARHRATR